ncbi:MAG TPA: flippase [Herpetosiphonaceae bacterium]
MTATTSISPRLAAAIAVFVAGLVLLALAVPATLLLARRRRVGPAQDQVVRLLQNSAVPFAIQLLNQAINFGFGLLLYRLLLDTAIGDFIFAAFITTMLLATIAEWGLNIYLTREVARDPDAIQRTFGTALLLRFAMAALVIPISLLIVQSYNGLQAAGLIEYAFDRQGLWLMLILAATVLPGALSAAVTALFLASERPIVPAVVNLMTNIVSALLKVGALVLGWGVLGVAWAALLATIMSAALFAVLLFRNWGWPRIHFDRRLAVTMLRAGWPLMLNSLLLAVFFRFDVAIIKAARATDLAAYDAAYRYLNLTQILPPIVINAVFPMFARQAASDRAALQRAYSYLVRLLLLLALPIATGVTILAPWLISIYGAQYVPLGAPALALLIWYLPLSYVNGVTQYVLIALDRPRTIMVSFTAAAIFNLIFNLLFVGRFGIQAAALATVLSEVVLFLPLWKVLRTEIEPAPLLRLAWRPTLAALGMGLCMLLATQIHVALSIIVGPLAFWCLLLLVGAVQEEDRRLARRVLRRA